MTSINFNGAEFTQDRWGDLIVIDSEGVQAVTIAVPHPDDIDALADGCQISPRGYHIGGDTKDARVLAAALNAAADIADLIDFNNQDARKEAERKREAEEAQLRAEEEARAAVIEERRHLLMNELMDARVKIRERGYKSMVICEVEVYDASATATQRYDYQGQMYVYDYADDGNGDWQVRWRWVNEHRRSQQLEHIARLDVKQGKGWPTVWDDGTDDLSSWEQDLKGLAKPTGQMYDGDLPIETTR